MNDLILALGPAFAAGLAVQRLLEIVDSIMAFLKGDRKKFIMAVASLGIAAMLCSQPNIRILKYLATGINDKIDFCITMLFISGGTEGFNSLLKFLNYQKENAKGAAAKNQSDAEQQTLRGKNALEVVQNT
jgi:hypothetical protein